ncbi:Transposase (plasmid) [Mycetohabitans rhizoxinica HKI 454]|uniref:Transposase n=1 Tax=Mycetohabitans rhizoxinica (strain DSM 19002 / CIP 109453 / HKI 454) TaxID=882378 RepID=E5AW88_MYCRK|nr:Transposase [Mycetohabitans rhizoxinica HKI 454]
MYRIYRELELNLRVKPRTRHFCLTYKPDFIK